MKETTVEAKEGSRASYKFSFCCFFCRRADIERERGGDKLHKQIARTIVCDIRSK